jgi:hypothetical protein
VNGRDYQQRNCWEQLKTGEDGEELSKMRPTLVSRKVEGKARSVALPLKTGDVPFSQTDFLLSQKRQFFSNAQCPWDYKPHTKNHC